MELSSIPGSGRNPVVLALLFLVRVNAPLGWILGRRKIKIKKISLDDFHNLSASIRMFTTTKKVSTMIPLYYI